MANRESSVVLKVLHSTLGPAAARPRARASANAEPTDVDRLHDLRGDEIATFHAIREGLPASHSRADEMLAVALAKQTVALRVAEAKLRDDPPGGEIELRARLRSVALLSDSVRKLSKDLHFLAHPRPAAAGSWDDFD